MSATIRIGNDITVKWRISILTPDGTYQDYTLDGRKLTLYLGNHAGKARMYDFSVDGNVLTWIFRGKDQKSTGRYYLTLVENEGQDNMHTVDSCEVFCLTAESRKASCGQPCGAVTAETVQLASVVSMGVPGPQGLSAYEVAVQSGFAGSEEEWLESMKMLVVQETGKSDSAVMSQKAVTEELNKKQGVLTQGRGIEISGGIISCTLDTTLFKIVEALPAAPEDSDTSKIFIVPAVSGEDDNRYVEYVFVNGKWEKLGEFKADVDLSVYATKTELLGTNEKINNIAESLAELGHNAEKAQVAADAAQSAVSAVSSEVDGIKKLIPAEASETNKLADKEFVNSSIATSTATFRGTYDSTADFPTTADDNDYVFLKVMDPNTPGQVLRYDRYKWNGTGWEFEFSLNNSSFTAAQWAAINSGITSSKITSIEQSISKSYVKPGGGIPKSDLSPDVQTSLVTDEEKTKWNAAAVAADNSYTLNISGIDKKPDKSIKVPDADMDDFTQALYGNKIMYINTGASGVYYQTLVQGMCHFDVHGSLIFYIAPRYWSESPAHEIEFVMLKVTGGDTITKTSLVVDLSIATDKEIDSMFQ